MRVLAIESSCDESAAAVLDEEGGLLAHELWSQVDLHRVFGGVVPELASRDHIRRALPLLEQVMAEAGYGGPEVKMQQLKMRLRSICNAILDQSIHAGNMSEQQALDLMMKEGFQQEGEAVAKWKRARLSSAQLSTYFVGVAEHLDLHDRAKARDGTAFNLKNYNDAVISFGSPPVKYVRELMGL